MYRLPQRRRRWKLFLITRKLKTSQSKLSIARLGFIELSEHSQTFRLTDDESLATPKHAAAFEFNFISSIPSSYLSPLDGIYNRKLCVSPVWIIQSCSLFCIFLPSFRIRFSRVGSPPLRELPVRMHQVIAWTWLKYNSVQPHLQNETHVI